MEKRKYLSESVKIKRIAEIEEDLEDVKLQISLTERQRQKYTNVQQFEKAAIMTGEMSELRVKKRKYEDELVSLQSKIKQSDRQKGIYKKKSSMSKSKNPEKGPFKQSKLNFSNPKPSSTITTADANSQNISQKEGDTEVDVIPDERSGNHENLSPSVDKMKDDVSTSLKPMSLNAEEKSANHDNDSAKELQSKHEKSVDVNNNSPSKNDTQENLHEHKKNAYFLA